MDGNYIRIFDYFSKIRLEHIDDEKVIAEIYCDRCTLSKIDDCEEVIIITDGMIIGKLRAKCIYANEEDVDLKKIEDNRM